MPDRASTAAVYLRVSTDHQHHSLRNQSETLNQYARLHGYTIVKRYVDEGRSGLNLSSRPALRRLLAEMMDSNRGFNTVLVYNVSRWGRFQDLDEASHYEFLCHKAGIQLRYCEEEFPNDGEPISFVFKTIRRVLAAEYSKHLSEEIYAAKHRSALLGYRTGGPTEFGLGRTLTTADKQPIKTLDFGERKILKDQYVVHALGPADQVDCVRQIFQHALRGKRPSWIAAYLNNRGINWLQGKQWTAKRVRNVLENELFAGYQAWGKTSCKLQGYMKKIPACKWIITEGVLEPLITKQRFNKVQRLIHPARGMSNDLLLENLRKLLSRKRKLNGSIIRNSRLVPSRSMYINRFGSLTGAYDLIGYKPVPEHLRLSLAGRKGIKFRDKLAEQLAAKFPHRITIIQNVGAGNPCPILLLDNVVRISIRTCSQVTIRQKIKWTLRRNIASRADLSLLCLLNKEGNEVVAFYLYPHFNSRHTRRFVLGSSFIAQGRKLPDISLLPEEVHKFLSERKPTEAHC